MLEFVLEAFQAHYGRVQSLPRVLETNALSKDGSLVHQR